MNYQKIHKSFRLNGVSFHSVEELLLFSKELSISIQQFLHDWFSDADDIKVQTSGSTGTPKLISIKKEYFINSALATGTFFNVYENTNALLCLSTNYIAGKMMLVRALILGWKLDIVKSSLYPLRGINKTYDFTAMVPLQLHHSINDLINVKKLIIGGGVVSYKLQKKLQTISTKVFATYGMTETVTHIAVKKLNNFSFEEKSVKKPFFKTLPNITISKDDRNCLVINAPKLAKTHIVTNDVVRIISSTEFEWLGRFDFVINSGGIKLHPEQIEDKLSEIISERFFVAGVYDEVLGEKLVLIIESKENNNLKSKITNLSLLKYETPKEIYFLNKFIETKTQKIHRKKTLKLISISYK